MSTVSIQTIVIPSASLGISSPLPDIYPVEMNFGEEIPFGGAVRSMLPYKLRDGYGEEFKPTRWKAVVLANEYLKATFLPEMGGRLISLVDLKSGRELLYGSDTIEPQPLSRTAAYVPGGIALNADAFEPFPAWADTVHTELTALSDGTPVVRMYHYERIQRLFFRAEALLPDNSRLLLVRARVDNVDRRALSICSRLRIAISAPDALNIRMSTREAGGPINPQHYLAVTDQGGYGLIQMTTTPHPADLPGAESPEDIEYKEGIQSDPTDAFHTLCADFTLKTSAERNIQSYSWMYGVGAVQLQEGQPMSATLSSLMPPEELHAWEMMLVSELVHKTAKPVLRGDGWAYTELMARAPDFDAHGLRLFAGSVGGAQREWIALIDQGELPCPEPTTLPKGYQVDDFWFQKLNESIRRGQSDHWYGQYHLGVMHAYRQNTRSAKACFERSLAHARAPWALYALSVIALVEDDKKRAAQLALEAVAIKPQHQLALEVMRILKHVGWYSAMDRLGKQLPSSIRRLKRIQQYRDFAADRRFRGDESSI